MVMYGVNEILARPHVCDSNVIQRFTMLCCPIYDSKIISYSFRGTTLYIYMNVLSFICVDIFI